MKAVRLAGWILLLLGSLLLVTWRQTRGVALETSLRGLEQERAMADAEAITLTRRIEELRSRSRILRVARERLGMRLPEAGEIVFLPAPADPPVAREAGL